MPMSPFRSRPQPPKPPIPAACAASHVVITVHGIRTFGDWQETLEELLKDHDRAIEVYSYSYGYFDLPRYTTARERKRQARHFRDWLLLSFFPQHPNLRRLDIVAHSFGSYVVAEALRMLPAACRLRVHTLILAASVLPETFPWERLLDERRVERIVNECGIHDAVLVWNHFTALAADLGQGGRTGFQGGISDRFRNRFYALGHTGYFERAKRDRQGRKFLSRPHTLFMRSHWLPLLTTDEPVRPIDMRQPATLAEGILEYLLRNIGPRGKRKLLFVACLLLAMGALASFWKAEEAGKLQALEEANLATQQCLLEQAAKQHACAALEQANQQRQADQTAKQQALNALQERWEKEKQKAAEAQNALQQEAAKRQTGEAAKCALELRAAQLAADLGTQADRAGLAATALHCYAAAAALLGNPSSPLALSEANRARLRDRFQRLPRLVTILGDPSDPPPTAVALNPTGTQLALASGNEVKLWDLASDRLVATLRKHNAPVTGVAFRPDGQDLVTASEDGTVYLWGAGNRSVARRTSRPRGRRPRRRLQSGRPPHRHGLEAIAPPACGPPRPTSTAPPAEGAPGPRLCGRLQRRRGTHLHGFRGRGHELGSSEAAAVPGAQVLRMRRTANDHLLHARPRRRLLSSRGRRMGPARVWDAVAVRARSWRRYPGHTHGRFPIWSPLTPMEPWP